MFASVQAFHIARHRERAAHQHDLAELLGDLRSLAECGGDVRLRAGGNVHQIVTVGLHRIDDEIDGRLGFGITLRVWDHRVSDAVLTVNECRNGQHLEGILRTGMRQTLVYGHFGVTEQFGDGQRIAHALLHEHIAVRAGDADQFDFRAAERIRNRKRIVDTGVEIKNELLHGNLPSILFDCDAYAPVGDKTFYQELPFIIPQNRRRCDAMQAAKIHEN